MKQLFIALLVGLSLCMPMQVNAKTYGPTAAKETLWSIASRLRPSTHVSTQQMMLALYRSNPHAFNRRNINSLKKGVYLNIPTLQQVSHQNQGQAIREAQRQNQNWQATNGISHTASNKLRQLRTEIKRLKQQLQTTRQKNRTLTQQLRTLRNNQGNSSATTAAQKQISQLRTEIKTLKETLGEREDQIKTMRAALKNASDSIKQQHAENKRIFDKLKAVSPDSIPAPKPAQGTPQLTLSALNENQQTEPKIWADEVQPAQTQTTGTTDNNPPAAQPVIKLVNDTRNNHAPIDAEPPQATSPSKLSFIVALFSLIFILALLWRTFSQRRQTRNEEEAIRREVEAMNKPIADDEHPSTKTDEDKKRKEPEIIF